MTIKLTVSVLTTILFCMTGLFAANFGEVTASALNVRAEAEAKSELVAKLTKGQKVEILEEKNDWLRIKIPANAVRVGDKKPEAGFVAKNFIGPEGKKDDKKSDKPDKKDDKKDDKKGGKTVSASDNSEELKKFLETFRPKEDDAKQITAKGYFYDVKHKNALYNLYKEEKGEYKQSYYITGEKKLRLGSFHEKNVKIVGKAYTIPEWKYKIIWIKSITAED